MKIKYLIVFVAFIHLSIKAQEKKITTFHRMLIINSEQKMLVVKIKNKDVWVTPGLYQNSKQSIKQGLDSIAETYGLKIYDIKFKGMYGLKDASKNYFSTRNIFVIKTDSNHSKLPEILDNALWLNVDEVIECINIPHINFFIEDVFKHRNSIRFGTVEKFKVAGKSIIKITEEFYSLNTI